MNADEYVSQRLDDQIGWYDRRSLACQRWYKRLRVTEFAAAAFIPFLAAYAGADRPVTTAIVGLLGVVIAIITATLGLYQPQERWIEYRTTCESLRKEKYLFLTGAAPYDGAQDRRLHVLVERVESLISKENTNWAQYMARPVEDASPSA